MSFPIGIGFWDGSGGWTPNTISSDWWFDFSNPANYTIVSTNVTEATDLTGNGYTATPFGSGPTIDSNDLNGLDTAHVFAQTLRLANFESEITDTSQNFTIFAVIKNNDQSGLRCVFGMGRTGSTTEIFNPMRWNGNNLDSFIRNSANVGVFFNPSPSVSTTQGDYYIISTSFDGSDWTLRVNGVEEAVVAGTPSGAVTFTDASIGGRRINSTLTEQTNVNIGEIFFKLDTLSPTDISEAETYLSDKWGISI